MRRIRGETAWAEVRVNGLSRWLAPLVALAAVHVSALGAIEDSFSPLVAWRQASGLEVTPIHIGLLPNGSLFFINEYNFSQHPEVNIAAPGFEPEFVYLMQTTPIGSALPTSILISPLENPASFMAVTDPVANTLRMKALPCTGHAFMADGNLFFASGADARVDLNLYFKGDLEASLAIDGFADSLTLNSSTSQWTLNPDAIVPGPQTGRPLRWYATVTRLADSRMMLTGGYEKVLPVSSYNPSVEAFDPAKNAWAAVSDVHATPPGLENPDYPHVFQFPYTHGHVNTVMMVGGSGEPLFLYLDKDQNSWFRTQKFRPGAKEYIDASAPQAVFPNFASSSALLPLRLPEDSWGYSNGSILYAGGVKGTPLESHVDVYDPVANAWRPSIPMHGPRHHPATVLLPDGRVLILNGWDDVSQVSQTGYAEYVDPRNGFALTQGTANMPETRGYHNLAVLLPDGRVLVASGNVDGNDGIERSDFRYYSPDYMTKARPQLLSVQDMNVGGYSYIAVPHNTSVSEATLMGLGAMTHSFDQNQRNVQLRVFDTSSTIRFMSGKWVRVGPKLCQGTPDPCQDLHLVQAPSSRELAPPGPYMLFILDKNRVPSAGKMLMLK